MRSKTGFVHARADPSALAQPSGLADGLLAAYSKLDTYCDTAHELEFAFATLTPSPPKPMEHCALRDGRYKATVGAGSSRYGLEITWYDGQRGGHYTRSVGSRPCEPIETYMHVTGPRTQATDIPPLIRLVLGWYWLAVPDLATLRANLDAFKPLPGQSTPELEAYETIDDDPAHRQRLWISRADGLIRRVSWSRPGSASIEVTQVRLNEPVTPAQLTHEAPLSLRLQFEAKSHALSLAAVVSALSPAVGFVFWRARWRRCPDRQAVLASRRRSWARYRRVVGWTVPAALLVALLAPTGGDMSGAATMAMRVVWAAVYTFLLWLIGLFLAARHFVER